MHRYGKFTSKSPYFSSLFQAKQYQATVVPEDFGYCLPPSPWPGGASRAFHGAAPCPSRASFLTVGTGRTDGAEGRSPAALRPVASPWPCDGHGGCELLEGLPSGKRLQQKSPLLMKKSTFLSAIFNSYVKLPEGKWTIVEDMMR